jgi:hypothetical protein
MLRNHPYDTLKKLIHNMEPRNIIGGKQSEGEANVGILIVAAMSLLDFETR